MNSIKEEFSFDRMRRTSVSESLFCQPHELEIVLQTAWRMLYAGSDWGQCVDNKYADAELDAMASAAYDYIIEPEGAPRIRYIAFAVKRPMLGNNVEIQHFASLVSEDLLSCALHIPNRPPTLDAYRQALSGLMFRYRYCVDFDIHLPAVECARIVAHGDHVFSRVVNNPGPSLQSPVANIILRALASLDNPITLGGTWRDVLLSID